MELTRFKETAVVAALKFIYTGGIDTEMENPQEVYELAKWYGFVCNLVLLSLPFFLTIFPLKF